jgi:hypothetical protein
MEKAASLTRSVAAGEGLRGHVLGQPTVFHIHAVDEDGRACSSGGNAFTVSIRGPSRVSPSLVDHARRRVRVRVGGLCHRQLPRIGAFGRRAHRRLTYHGVSRHAGTRPDAVPHDGTRKGDWRARLAAHDARKRPRRLRAHLGGDAHHRGTFGLLRHCLLRCAGAARGDGAEYPEALGDAVALTVRCSRRQRGVLDRRAAGRPARGCMHGGAREPV